MDKLLTLRNYSLLTISLIVMELFWVPANAQQNIDSLEYGVDNIAAYGQAANKIPITPAAVINNYPFNVNIASVGNGIHTLLVRTHSKTTIGISRGFWSETNYTYFYKQSNVATTISNIQKLEYFIDADPGEGSGIAINVSPAVQVSGVAFNPNIGALGNGFHVLYIRSLDLNGKWSITNYQYFYKQNNIPTIASNAKKLEYFIDTDPGEGNANAINITPAVQVSGISFTPNIGSLSIGFHVLFIRSLDINGKWSITNYQYFYKQNNIPTIVSTVNRMEYFIDTDPGEGNGHSIPLTQATIIPGLNINVDISTVTPGFHVIYIRTRDANGKWSITNYSYFTKSGPQIATPVNIVKIEYYIDTDPGYNSAVSIPVTPAQDIPNKGFSANVNGLSSGTHFLYIRSLDSRSKWSLNAMDSFHILIGLPLSLLNFTATPEANSVSLAWQTSFEQNLLSYVLEYSVDGNNFSTIGILNPANNPLGSSYQFKHLTPAKGINFYRLKIIESDNSYHFSAIRPVNFSGGKPLVTIYPDPADKYFQVKSDLSHYQLEIFTAEGKMVKNIQVKNPAVNVEVKDLPSGLYTIRITADNINSSTMLVIKH